MIVVDTSVVVHLFVSSELSEAAERALLNDSDWIVPRLWRSEFRNVLATLVRTSRLPLKNALAIMVKAEALLRDREYEIRSDAVIAVSTASGASGYDCEFVVLAQQFEVPLLTTDRKLVRAFPETATLLE